MQRESTEPEDEKLETGWPVKHGWQRALQKLREENAGLKKKIDALAAEREGLREVLEAFVRAHKMFKGELTAKDIKYFVDEAIEALWGEG